jgi:hypothetical protein
MVLQQPFRGTMSTGTAADSRVSSNHPHFFGDTRRIQRMHLYHSLGRARTCLRDCGVKRFPWNMKNIRNIRNKRPPRGPADGNCPAPIKPHTRACSSLSHIFTHVVICYHISVSAKYRIKRDWCRSERRPGTMEEDGTQGATAQCHSATTTWPYGTPLRKPFSSSTAWAPVQRFVQDCIPALPKSRTEVL